MKYKLFFVTLFASMLCVGTLRINAQASQTNYFLPTFYPRAPNTASIEKFGSYEVSKFTGVPNISIPLYTIEAGDIKIPISLSYHASGIRVSEVASWVGLGWSLSAGGVISRNVMGKADDGIGGYLQGFLKSSNAFSGKTDADIDSLYNYSLGLYDSRPDIFSYDFPGHNGKFFLDGTNSYTPRLIPFAPLKVTYNYVSGGNPILNRFNIADEHGNNYTFGDNYLEPTYTNSQSTTATAVTSGWPLEKVISQNQRDTVNFNYLQQFVYNPDVVSNTDIVDDQIQQNINAYTYGYKQGPQNISSSYVGEQLLQHIYFKNGRVDFELDPSARADLTASSTYGLKDVAVYKYNYSLRAMELQKKILFFKSYFNPSTSGSQRLRLDSIQITDKAGGVLQRYSFGYNTANGLTLPPYLSLARDYWGFYNGKANSSLTPQMTVQVYQGGTVNNMTIGSTVPNGRNSDSTYMQACVLTGIHYPTGGYTTFTYQTNQYYKAGVLQQAGGLRVKTISSYDGVNPVPIVKTYQYDNSSAVANFILDYCFFSTSQIHNQYNNFGNNGDPATLIATERETTYVSNPRIDLEPWDASLVLYPHVTEYIGTPTANTGYSDYLYTSLWDTENIGSLTGIPIVNSYFFARGQLTQKTDALRKTDGTYQVVKRVNNTYTAFPITYYNNVGLTVTKNIVNEGIYTKVYPEYTTQPIQYNGFLMANYNILGDDNYLTSTTTTNFDLNNPSNYTTSTENYKYDNISHQQITRTYHTDSKGNTIVKRDRYPGDYLVGSTTGSVVLDSMLNRNMLAVPIESYDSLKNAATATSYITTAQLNQYKNGTIANTIVPAKISTLTVSAPITDFAPASYSGNWLTPDSRYVQMINFDQYDSQNNLSQYSPKNSSPVNVMWDYLQQWPIAQSRNAPAPNISLLYFAYTSFEGDGKGNWNYSGSSITDPTAPTGSRVYPLTGGSITTNVLDNTKAYIVSYWSNNGAATLLYGSATITGTALATSQGWTYYEHQLPSSGSGGSITLSGSASVDELRLYPSDSQMTTYAYDPNGVTAIADARGGIDHYEYDSFQRLKNVKDRYGNIITNNNYHTYDQIVPNDAVTATLSRNNCPAGTSPQSASYTVPAAKYYAFTKTSANAEATYDLNTSGQNYVNNPAVCGCPIQTITFTLNNTSGTNGYQATFSGPNSYTVNFPNSGASSVTMQIAVGSYTVSVGPVGTFTHTFTLGNRTPVSGQHLATFNSVNIANGSTDLTLSITP